MKNREPVPFTEDIVMKFTEITLSDGRRIDGEETARILMAECDKSGHVWMGIDSLPRGMAEKRVSRFLSAIGEGRKIHLYICVNNRNYRNEIAFSALIGDIAVSADPMPCPEKSGRPEVFSGGTSRNWVRLTDMKEEHQAKAEDFIVTSTGSDLKWLLEHSRMSFAYVSERYGY